VGAAASTTSGAPAEIELELQAWPIVRVRPHGTPTDEQMQAFLEEYRAMENKRGGPYVLVLDLRFCAKISPAQRKMLTDDMAEPGQDAPCKAMAMIFDSKILRGILTAIFWVRRPPYPLRVFTEPGEGELWALDQLAKDTGGNESPGWYAQADATSKVEKAQTILRKMQYAEMQAHIARDESTGRVYFVPRAGPFADRADALLAAERLCRDLIDTRVMRLYHDE
jgi:hypothetical protein